jgi:hypothetical protein
MGGDYPYVNALTVIGTDLYAGGWFTTAGGVSVNNIAKWDGTNWDSLGSGTSSGVAVLAVIGTDLYTGGWFGNAGGVSAKNIAKWDGTNWSALGSGTNHEVYALAIIGTKLYAGGYFTTAGGKASSYIARWFPYRSRIDVNNRWNLVSVPLDPFSNTKDSLFSGSITPAYGYSSGYSQKDTLESMKGYWLKFSSAGSIQISGVPIETNTAEVVRGWNLIGTISYPLLASSITIDPPELSTSKFFGYRDGYFFSDTLFPGKGYWVKANQAGKLILSSPSSSKTSSRFIKIVDNGELPPPPPDEMNVHPVDLPKSYALEQNYPNPFNPMTEIHYQLPLDNYVTLNVYDVLGKQIATLVNGMQTAGYKVVSFDATNMPSGLYFYRLTAGTFTNMKKMVLVK